MSYQKKSWLSCRLSCPISIWLRHPKTCFAWHNSDATSFHIISVFILDTELLSSHEYIQDSCNNDVTQCMLDETLIPVHYSVTITVWSIVLYTLPAKLCLVSMFMLIHLSLTLFHMNKISSYSAWSGSLKTPRYSLQHIYKKEKAGIPSTTIVLVKITISTDIWVKPIKKWLTYLSVLGL